MKIPSTYISKVSLFALSMSYDNYGKRVRPPSKAGVCREGALWPLIRRGIGFSVSWCKPIAIFDGGYERFNHLGVYIVAVELLKLVQPEIIASKVAIRCVVRVPA